MHSQIMGQSETGINVDLDPDTPWWQTALKIIAGIVVGIAVVALVVHFGLISAIVGVLGKVGTILAATGASTVIKVGAGVMIGSAVLASGYTDNMFLPLYSFSAEEIFKGDILLFDVDFFNPQKNIYAMVSTKTISDSTDTGGNNGSNEYESQKSIPLEEVDKYLEPTETEVEGDNGEKIKMTTSATVDYYYFLKDESLPDTEGNRIITSKQNTALDLQPVISKWYTTIRNIAIVLSMSVLLYIGIRMFLSTVGQEKAKYKQMLMDWLVGICLLFFMHYIMVFSVSMVKNLNGFITASENEIKGYTVQIEDDEEHYISDKVKDIGREDLIGEDGKIYWPTNLMGKLRINAQVSYGDMAFVGYGLCYVILVLFTIYFVFVYLKRVLYMAFLTMIAPIVALTYPIDKINDGQAQGFNKWLKEYIFNLLLQPLHLLLFTILITSATDLVANNIVYALVAMGFLIPAEKFMRGLFGFEKASTPGSMAGAATAATVLNSGLQKILHRGSGGKGGGKGSKDADSESGTPPRMGYNEENNYDALDEVAGEAPRTEDTPDDEDEPKDRHDDREDTGDGHDDDDDGGDRRDTRDRHDDGDGAGGGHDDEEDSGDRHDAGDGHDDGEGAGDGHDDDDDGENRHDDEGERERSDRRILRKPTNRQERKERDKAMLQAMGRGAVFTAKQTGRKLTKMAPKAVRTVGKIGAGVAVGTIAGVAGATIGIATGDPSKAVSFTAGAAAAGGALGSSIIKTDRKPKTQEQIAREKAFWGDEYNDYTEKEYRKKWKKDFDKRTKIEQNLNKQQVNELYKNGKLDQYFDNDVTDVKDIIALEKMQAGGKSTFAEAMAAYNAHDAYGNIEKMKPKDRKDVKDNYVKEFVKRGNSEEDAKTKTETLSKNTARFANFKNKIQ